MNNSIEFISYTTNDGDLTLDIDMKLTEGKPIHIYLTDNDAILNSVTHNFVINDNFKPLNQKQVFSVCVHKQNDPDLDFIITSSAFDFIGVGTDEAITAFNSSAFDAYKEFLITISCVDVGGVATIYKTIRPRG